MSFGIVIDGMVFTGEDRDDILCGPMDKEGYPLVAVTCDCCDKFYILRAQEHAWEAEHQDKVPDGARVVVTCGNKQCVNPNHLKLSRKGRPSRSGKKKGGW